MEEFQIFIKTFRQWEQNFQIEHEQFTPQSFFVTTLTFKFEGLQLVTYDQKNIE